MPQFNLDECGTVDGLRFADLDGFTQGFIECGFFLSEGPGVDTQEFLTEEYQEGIREGTVDGTIPGDVGFGDLQPASLREIMAICEEFQRENEALLAEAYERDYDSTQAGRDYWFTHTGAGVGYWDRKELENEGAWEANGWPEVGDPTWDAYMAARENSIGKRLTEASGRGEFYLEFEGDGEGGGTVYFQGY